MKTITFGVFILLCVLVQFESGRAGQRDTQRQMHVIKEDNAMDVTDFSVYYDLNTNATIRKMMPRPWYQPGWRLRLPFQGGRCNCDTFKCNCCSGMRVTNLGFNKETCAVLTFEPNEGLLGLDVKLNNETILNKSFTVSNPPPYCIPIPIPGIPIPLLDMCIRLFDITVNWNKMHVCMDWDTRIDKAPVVILHFDCMNLGLGGVSITKPGSSNLVPPENETSTEVPQVGADVYDPVTEIANLSTVSPLFNSSVKYI